MNPHPIPNLSVILSPATLFKFHKALVDRKYRLLFSSSVPRRKPGPKGPSPSLIAAIGEMKRRNAKFGCVRISQQISYAFGVHIDKDVVRRVLEVLPACARRQGSFVFRCESILLKSHWVMAVMDLFTRRLVGLSVAPAPIDGVRVCRMFNHALAAQPLPRYLSTDHDPLFRFHRWLANLRVLDIEEIKSVPYAPVSHPFVERLIGNIRREVLDQMFFWNAFDLTRKLEMFRRYYNEKRVHRSLGGTTPTQRAGASAPAPANLDHYSWWPYCHGLFQIPVAA